MYWLSDQRLHVDPQHLRQMSIFCESAIRTKPSFIMVNTTRDLLCQVKVRVTSSQSVRALFATLGNQQDHFWVKKSVLHDDTVEKRADVLNFFIDIAQVSWT